MITITYPQPSQSVENWKDQLEALVTAHKLIQDNSINEPILKDSSEVIKGEKGINEYMDSLAKFQEAWFACSCG